MALAAFLPVIGKVIDRVFPDKKAAAEAKVKLFELEQQGALAELDAEFKQEAERTARHSADMSSDSWLSKNIRPLVLVFLTVVYVLIAISDSADNWAFNVPQGHQETLNAMLLAVYGFYFVSRGIEKVVQLTSKK